MADSEPQFAPYHFNDEKLAQTVCKLVGEYCNYTPNTEDYLDHFDGAHENKQYNYDNVADLLHRLTETFEPAAEVKKKNKSSLGAEQGETVATVLMQKALMFYTYNWRVKSNNPYEDFMESEVYKQAGDIWWHNGVAEPGQERQFEVMKAIGKFFHPICDRFDYHDVVWESSGIRDTLDECKFTVQDFEKYQKDLAKYFEHAHKSPRLAVRLLELLSYGIGADRDWHELLGEYCRLEYLKEAKCLDHEPGDDYLKRKYTALQATCVEFDYVDKKKKKSHRNARLCTIEWKDYSEGTDEHFEHLGTSFFVAYDTEKGEPKKFVLKRMSNIRVVGLHPHRRYTLDLEGNLVAENLPTETTTVNPQTAPTEAAPTTTAADVNPPTEAPPATGNSHIDSLALDDVGLHKRIVAVLKCTEEQT